MFKAANFVLPDSPHTIKSIVFNFAAKKRAELKKVLKEDLKESALSITLDQLWTSTRNRNRRYVNVNLHRSGKFYNLGLMCILGSYDAEKCDVLLENLLAEYDIDSTKQICAMTTDGAPVMKRFQGLLPSVLPQLCFARTIHLAVCDVICKVNEVQEENEEVIDDEDDEEDDFDCPFVIEDDPNYERWEATSDFNDLAALLRKVRRVVKRFKMSPGLSGNLLWKHHRSDGLKEFVFILDCQTRWSSTLSMLERFVYLKSAIDKALYDTKSEDKFPEEEWSLLDSIVTALKLVSITIKRICKSDANLLTADTAISFLIRQLGNSPFELKLRDAILERVLEHRTINSDVLQYLHNRCQTDLIPAFLQVDRTKVQKVVIELGNRLRTKKTDEDDELVVGDVVVEEKCGDLEHQLEEILASQTQRQITRDTLVSELNMYNQSGFKGKLITRVYESLLTVRPTSVAVERTVSVAGMRATKFSARMGDDSLNCLFFLNSYFNQPF